MVPKAMEYVECCPGQVAQLVRASSWYTMVVGSIPGQGTYKNQPMNASVHGTTNQCFSLSKKSINKTCKKPNMWSVLHFTERSYTNKVFHGFLLVPQPHPLCPCPHASHCDPTMFVEVPWVPCSLMTLCFQCLKILIFLLLQNHIT